MKKMFLLSTLLLIALISQAQSLKVAPTLKKGDVKTYVYNIKTQAAGKEVTTSCEAIYSVIEETADGFVITNKTTGLKTDGANDIVERMMTASSKIMNDVEIEIVTDKDGQPKSLRNFDKAKERFIQNTDDFIKELKELMPEIGSMLPAEMLKSQLSEALSEEMVFRSLLGNSSPLALNGKTISTGVQDVFTNDKGLKMKRMYFVNGKDKVTVTSALDMSKDELKAAVIEQLSKAAPDQAEMIRQNIDLVMASGQMNIESSEKANFELDADGWVKQIVLTGDTKSMGQSVKSEVTISLK